MEKKILFPELISIVKWTELGFFLEGDNIIGPDDRISVENTPLKVYFYWRSFKNCVAVHLLNKMLSAYWKFEVQLIVFRKKQLSMCVLNTNAVPALC